MDIRNLIQNVPDWPVAGVQFKDITPVLADPDAFKFTVDSIVEFAKQQLITDIVAPDARGFIWAAPVALALGVPLHIVRKPGKLPPPTVGYEYQYEYASGSLHMKQDTALAELNNVLVIDDVSATGGTAMAIVELLKQFKINPLDVCYACVIDLTFLGGTARLENEGIKTYSVVEYL